MATNVVWREQQGQIMDQIMEKTRPLSDLVFRNRIFHLDGCLDSAKGPA